MPALKITLYQMQVNNVISNASGYFAPEELKSFVLQCSAHCTSIHSMQCNARQHCVVRSEVEWSGVEWSGVEYIIVLSSTMHCISEWSVVHCMCSAVCVQCGMVFRTATS